MYYTKTCLERFRIKIEPRIARLESKFNSQAKRVKCTCKFLPYFYIFVLQSIISRSEAKDHKNINILLNFVPSTFGFSDDHLLTN